MTTANRTGTARGSYSPGAASRRLARAAGDSRHRTLAVLIMWLLVWRLVIPGFFNYGSALDAKGFASMVEEGALLNNIIWYSLFGFALLIIATRSAAAKALAKSLNVFMILMVSLAVASVLWSAEPHATAARLSHLVILVLDCAAVTLAGGWNPTRFQEIMRPIVTALLVGSIIFGILYPDLVIMPPAPRDTKLYWRGLTSHKNELGGLAGMGIVFWTHAWLAKEAGFFKAAFGVGSAAACLYLARSSTAWMATGFAVIFMLMLLRSPRSLRRYMPFLVGLFTVLVLAYALAVLKLVPGLDLLLVPITALTGKDTTFTDRTRIWEVIEFHIRQNPFLGTGYGGYWIGPFPTSASYIFMSILYIYPWEAHNGYLDIGNDLGYAGLICLVGFAVVFIRQSVRLMNGFRTQAALYLALIFWELLANLGESQWFRPGWSCVIISFATFALARGLIENSARARSGRSR